MKGGRDGAPLCGCDDWQASRLWGIRHCFCSVQSDLFLSSSPSFRTLRKKAAHQSFNPDRIPSYFPLNFKEACTILKYNMEIENHNAVRFFFFLFWWWTRWGILPSDQFQGWSVGTLSFSFGWLYQMMVYSEVMFITMMLETYKKETGAESSLFKMLTQRLAFSA